MLIVSWNVAAWKKTVENIWEHHKPKELTSSGVSSPAAQAAAVVNYLLSMGADVLCLQEVKIDRLKLSDFAMMIGARSEEFDVFFSLPGGGDSISGASGGSNVKSTSRQQGGGLNGVASYVRKGLACGACSTALDGGGELDKEGRCIMTDHGSFVVFNVYVPNGQGGQRMVVKQSFLLALKAAMEKERRRGVKVILCGDLNIHYRAQDCFKYWRRININSMLYDPQTYLSKTIAFDVGTPTRRNKRDEAFEHKLKTFLQYLADEWRPIEQVLLDTLKVVTEGWNNDGSGGSGGNGGSSAGGRNASGVGGGGAGAKGGTKTTVQVAVKVKVKHPSTKKDVVLKTKRDNISQSQASTDGGLASGTADTVSRMKWSFNLGGRYVNSQSENISAEEYNNGLIKGERVMQVKTEGCLDVEDLRKAVSMLCTNYFDPDTFEKVSISPYSQGKEAREAYERKMDPLWDAIAADYGDAAASQVDVEWVHGLLGLSRPQQQQPHQSGPKGDQEQGGGTAVMVDPFAAVHTEVDSRFTIWSQYTNERYRNEGTRIDFTLCDMELWQKYGQAGGPLEGYTNPKIAAAAAAKGTAVDSSCIEKDEAVAAFNAATNFNAFQQAPFDGGGMPKAAEDAYQVHLRSHHKTLSQPQGNLHTGIIYTPPEYSDHVAVSLLLDDSIKASMSLPLKLGSDKDTRAAQPHLKQQTISSFFSKASASSSSSSSGGVKRPSSSSSSSASISAAAKKKKTGLQAFFGKP